MRPADSSGRDEPRRAGAGRSRGERLRLGIALALVGGALCSALFAPVLAPHDPLRQDVTKRLLAPAWQSGRFEYFLGTDPLGRDLLSRLIYGARVSLAVGGTAVLVAGSVGTLLGLLAGYLRGTFDALVMRIADVQLAIPFFVLAIAVAAVLGAGLLNTIAVLGITGWVVYARVVRGQVLSLREREYVQAARALGQRSTTIVIRHIFPNLLASIVVIASLEVARMILLEAALSFLGLGVQPPTPSWGEMAAQGREYLPTAWWVSTFPGLAIILTVLGTNLLGDYLRDRSDPTLQRGD